MVTTLPSLARGILDGVTRHIGVILGKGPFFVYPRSWVPTHPHRALGAAARGSSLGEFCSCTYHGRTFWWCAVSMCFVKYSARFSLPGCHCTSNSLFNTWSMAQKNHISVDRDRRFSHSVIRNSCSCAIVAMHCCWRLTVSQFSEG